MISYWLYLDLIAFVLISFTDEAKHLYKTMIYDLQQGFFFDWFFLVVCFLIVMPLSIPFSIIKIIKQLNDK